MTDLKTLQKTLKSLDFEIAQEIYKRVLLKAAEIDRTHVQRHPKKHPLRLVPAIKFVQTGSGYSIYVDETIAPHAQYIILGTKDVPSRDFITEAILEVQAELRRDLN